MADIDANVPCPKPTGWLREVLDDAAKNTLITRAEAEQMAKAQVAAFKENLWRDVVTLLRDRDGTPDDALDWLEALFDGKATDDSSLREHDAATLKRILLPLRTFLADYRTLDGPFNIEGRIRQLEQETDELAAAIKQAKG